MKITPDADEIVQGVLRDQRPTNRMDEIASYLSDDTTVIDNDYEKGRREGMKYALQRPSDGTFPTVEDWQAYNKGMTDGEALIKSLRAR